MGLKARTVSYLHNEEDVVEIKKLEGEVEADSISSPSIKAGTLDATSLSPRLANLVALKPALIGEAVIGSDTSGHVKFVIGKTNPNAIYILTFGNTFTILLSNNLTVDDVEYYVAGCYTTTGGAKVTGGLKYRIIKNLQTPNQRFSIDISSADSSKPLADTYTAYLFSITLYN